jgi:Lactoylglutathione lyase and related lyases
MVKVIHSMIRVLELERSLKFYADVLGLHEAYRLDFPEFALVYLRNTESDFEIELTLNKGRVDPYTHGTGYGHIGAVIADAATTHAALRAQGYEPAPIKEFKRDDDLIARFFFIQDPDGYKIEMLERHGHYQ